MLGHGQNNSFSFSKKLFRVGLTWVFSISASRRNAASCSGVKVLRHLDVHLHVQVAAAAIARVGHAAPLSVNTSPLCVPAGIVKFSRPSSVGTSIAAPNAACG